MFSSLPVPLNVGRFAGTEHGYKNAYGGLFFLSPLLFFLAKSNLDFLAKNYCKYNGNDDDYNTDTKNMNNKDRNENKNNDNKNNNLYNYYYYYYYFYNI